MNNQSSLQLQHSDEHERLKLKSYDQQTPDHYQIQKNKQTYLAQKIQAIRFQFRLVLIVFIMILVLFMLANIYLSTKVEKLNKTVDELNNNLIKSVGIDTKDLKQTISRIYTKQIIQEKISIFKSEYAVNSSRISKMLQNKSASFHQSLIMFEGIRKQSYDIIVAKNNEAKNQLSNTKFVLQSLVEKLNTESNYGQTSQKLTNFLTQIQQIIHQCIILDEQLNKKIQKIYSELQDHLNQQKIKILNHFFSKFKIQSINLLLKQEKEFQAASFWEKCESVPNTLIIIKNQHNQIIGGFTPIEWKKKYHQKYSEDDSLDSFLFSISNMDKIPLVDARYAIFHDGTSGPIFGKQDLYIADGVQKNHKSATYIGQAYSSNQYPKNSEESRQKFSGSKTGEFLIQHIEIYELKFK